MTDASYSKSETDSKLALIEERIDRKFDRMLVEVKEGFVDLNNRFTQELQSTRQDIKLLDKEMSWVKWVSLISTGILISAVAKYLFH